MAIPGAILLVLLGEAEAHGYMNQPPARFPGALPLSDDDVGGCGECSCCWFSDSVSREAEPTVCDPALHTMGNCNDPCCSSAGYSMHPWLAPGTAPLTSPCGTLHRPGFPAQDGRDLPPGERTTWQRGTAVEVGQTLNANHGGGYAFRLCPANAELSEECFRSLHLSFADTTSKVVFPGGGSMQIPATRTSNVTYGGMWSKNPIPWNGQFPAPCEGCEGHRWAFSLVDRVLIPAELAVGDYVLSWRWDCEETAQVWANCADITVVDGQTMDV